MIGDQLEMPGVAHEAEQQAGQSDIFGQLADLGVPGVTVELLPADCTCYWDCYECPDSGARHFHGWPCPSHPIEAAAP